MRTQTLCILTAIALCGRLVVVRAQTAPEPPSADAISNSAPMQAETPAATTPQEEAAPPAENDQNMAPPPTVPQPEAAPTENGAATEPPTSSPATAPEDTGVGKGLFLNFHNAPIDLVLNYLSDAAGFIIEVDTPVRGRVDVWSTHPVTKDEAVDLLNSMLNKNGYAAIRNGRKLTIVSKDDAIHGDIPVKTGNDPDLIPKNDEIVTQIIPIRFVEAEQLIKDLSPMISSHATIVANEAGNSIAVTDTQANIRHLVEIIKAIDSSAEDETELRVFHLKHHDPNEIASLLTSLFSSQSNSGTSQTPIRFGGPGGFGGFGGFAARMAAAASANSPANSQAARIKKRQEVVAVADPRTSSVAVTASKDMMEQIAKMVEQLDQPSPRVPRVSVVHLENADPQEVEQVLQDMFQSSQTPRSSQNQLSPLQTRIQQNTGTSTTTGTGMGTTGLGTSRSGLGGAAF
ncbi:MAG TPA: secretin N-terminal domain-containing protein [Verrucomicrobiae bacterium]|nr:secretin N-terminal domain-containing protein [Verrucomicrobiae bacterium]